MWLHSGNKAAFFIYHNSATPAACEASLAASEGRFRQHVSFLPKTVLIYCTSYFKAVYFEVISHTLCYTMTDASLAPLWTKFNSEVFRHPYRIGYPV